MSAAKMRNIGPKSAAWLRQVGLRTHEDLAAVGTVEAFMRVKRAGFKPTLNLLYAIEGALLDCHWQEISEERRQELILAADAATALLPAPRNKPAAAPVRTTVHADEGGYEAGAGFAAAGERDDDHGDGFDRDGGVEEHDERAEDGERD
ncbi:TfoX/Sxy family protein [Lysobacter sp. BMK333-48F3]|uniref:TfoX/Sxy family protein n=1 Tax=Lysobacter sp. BMK333-48F3 TaxID=2867962 RepID=UPI001C8C1951|nr:TfoX/Sxy family protein [Lysobacter sp. BMK333-48F3]MBX9401660.1 TfoX/Sxy family protein [Lysobacter sp. BMK333-48F3]